VTYVYRLYAGRWRKEPAGPFNSDEHPRIEFLTPVTYRDRGFLTHNSLIKYFDETLAGLPGDAVRFEPAPDEALEEHAAKHALQRQVLMGQMRGRR
jgi:spermidine synthase